MNKNVIIAILVIIAMVLYWNRNSGFENVTESPNDDLLPDESSNDDNQTGGGWQPESTIRCPTIEEVATTSVEVALQSSQVCLDGNCTDLNIYTFTLQGVEEGSSIVSLSSATDENEPFGLFVMGYSGTIYQGGNNGTQVLQTNNLFLPELTYEWFGGSTTPAQSGSDFGIIFNSGTGVTIEGDTPLIRISVLGGTLQNCMFQLFIKPPNYEVGQAYSLKFINYGLSEGAVIQASPLNECL